MAQLVVVFRRRRCADEEIVGDGGEVHGRNRIIGGEVDVKLKSFRLKV